MDYNYFTPTGELIKEYLLEKGISQKELATRLNISEKHISNFLSGKIHLTEEMAIKLEFIFNDIPASYWLNYESKYREFLAKKGFDLNLKQSNIREIAKKFKFKEIFSKNCELDIWAQAKEVLKLLSISSFENFDNSYNNIPVEFFQDGGEKESIVIWIKLCEKLVNEQNKIDEEAKFSLKNLRDNLHKFKNIALNSNIQESMNTCRKLCNKLGIYLVIREPISNSKVRGVLTTYNNRPAIFLSGRYKTHDHIWFAFIHEIKHLLDDYNKKEVYVSFDDIDKLSEKEIKAHEYARDYFINPVDYKKFINEKNFDSTSLERFAKSQNVNIGMLIGRLQHDGFISNSSYNYKKNRM